MIDHALDTPWKVGTELRRWLSYPTVRLLFAWNGIPWGRGWRIYGAPVIQKHRKACIRLGDDLQLRSTLGSNPLGVTHPVILAVWRADALLEIGDGFAMSGGVLCALSHISIGCRVNIGANSSVVDSDFHPLSAGGRKSDPQGGETAPVIIEDDVFIGMNCLVLKGVTIGCGSVIGAASVVTHSIPAGVVAAGNPARVIKEL